MLMFTIFSGCTEIDDDISDNDRYLGYVEGNFVNASMEIVNFSKEVAEDGSVTYESVRHEANGMTFYRFEKMFVLTVYNNQSSFAQFDLMFVNPINNNEGLHDNLESSNLRVHYQNVIDLWNGDYTGRVINFQLEPGEVIMIPITFKFERSYSGTFQDGQHYTCYFYAAGNTNQIQKIPFEVWT